MARPPYPFEVGEPLAERVKRQEQTIERLRWDLVNLAPDEFRELLHSFFHCENRVDAHRWQDEVAEKIAAQTSPLWNPELAAQGQARAYCPLCRGGATNYYGNEPGFKLPEGLRRHLVGFGKSAQCVVMRAASEIARDYWHEKFYEREQQAARAAHALKQQRQKSEPVYVLGPTEAPVLLDDDSSSWRPARPPGQEAPGLGWAEQRLAQLGFQVVVDGTRRSFTKAIVRGERELIIYADPRNVGAIKFRVFDTKARGQKRGRALAWFEIQDRWKNGLEDRVAAGVAQVNVPPPGKARTPA